MQATAAEKLLVVLLARLANCELDDSATHTSPPKLSEDHDSLHSRDTSIGTATELRQLIGLCREAFVTSGQSVFLVTQELKAFFDAMQAILAPHRLDPCTLSDEERRVETELLEQITGAYRWCYYHRGCSGQVAELHTQHVLVLLDLAQRYANVMFSARQRSAGAIHALAARA